MTEHATDLAHFDAAIAEAKGAEAAYLALEELVRATVGAKLFTVMTVDMKHDLSRRAYTSDPVNYPTSGTKPINYGPWFDTVHTQKAYFIANTIEDIAKVLFDHELINELGCQSIVNMPVIVGGTLIAVVNILDVAGHFTPERVQLIRDVISVPAKLAVLAAR
ncbi:GAF domain-containing protein [Devosia chinhatensis]|uniref:GAF domain-containing protein n=2 Tax=Devosia aurantiaca TaxID=2714858 RepID=A0A6M1SGZ9_9HYPH|nr:GAF domain-containing protein [Devosia aurantiaca]